jgi:hypothetical protein
MMFGLGKKEKRAISSMDDALKIVQDIQSAGGIEKVVVHRQEPQPPYVGFAGTYNHSYSTPSDIQTNILRRATIEFYVK